MGQHARSAGIPFLPHAEGNADTFLPAHGVHDPEVKLFLRERELHLLLIHYPQVTGPTQGLIKKMPESPDTAYEEEIRSRNTGCSLILTEEAAPA